MCWSRCATIPPPHTILFVAFSQSQQAEAEAAQKNREAQRKQKELDESRRIAEGKRVRTPDPVVGRSHGGTQTDSYLETLSDKVPEADGTTQTDAFMDRPPTPMFVPAKIGLDKATQIAAGDLFDFDREVEPILEVLVGKTLEQSLMEVHEDIELENIRARQVSAVLPRCLSCALFFHSGSCDGDPA
jgi:radial spoke head protein 3